MLNRRQSHFPCLVLTAIAIVFVGIAGCGSDEKKQRDEDFITSGSRDADQRAEQRIAKDQQIRGKSAEEDKGAKISDKKPLYARLGGDEGISTIVSDWVDRFLADPRVNYSRGGVKTGRVFKSDVTKWDKTPGNIAELKKYYAQFINVAAGGPTRYDGPDMKNMYAGRQFTNAEFDATIGDLKATLDNLRIPADVQKELIAVIESTRPQVVEVR